MKNLAIALFCLALVGGCASDHAASGGDYGQVGSEVVALYDAVADDGMIELELDPERVLRKGDRGFIDIEKDCAACWRETRESAQVVDFANTAYIDSSGLGVLVSLSKKIREQGGELVLASLNEDLRTLFELTKLDTLFRIADDKDQALEGF